MFASEILGETMVTCAACKKAEAEIRLDYAKRNLCRECFTIFFERKVRNAVLKYHMFSMKDKVALSVSGGKDSGALLAVLKRLFPRVEIVAIHLNLGIEGYSNACEEIAKKIAKAYDVELIVCKLRKVYGFSISDFRETRFSRKICASCGVVKRYLLNKTALDVGVAKLATGHNLDDFVGVLFNHYVHGDVEQLKRLLPVNVSHHPKMVTRIKPLCEITEKETKYYADCLQLPYTRHACPFVHQRRLEKRQRLLDKLSEVIPNFRQVFFKSHVKRLQPALQVKEETVLLRECICCGMPTSGEICSFCKIVSTLTERKRLEQL